MTMSLGECDQNGWQKMLGCISFKGQQSVFRLKMKKEFEGKKVAFLKQVWKSAPTEYLLCVLQGQSIRYILVL